MPAATGTYRAWGPYLRDWLKGQINPETAGRYKALLTTAAFTPDLDADQRQSNVTNEVFEVGSSWPQGGITLANVAVTLDAANDRVTLTHDPILAAETTFASPGAKRLVIYDTTGGSAAANRLAFTMLLDQALLPVAGPVAVSSPNGIARGNY